MQYRTLGNSGIRISTLTLGTMTFGGVDKFAQLGQGDVALAQRMLDRCRDVGINSIDTANMYSQGKAEEIIGAALGKHRDDFILASKVRMPAGAGPNAGGASRHQLIAACEASLRRLQTSHLDLYYIHEWDGVTPLEETLSALDRLIADGKIRYAAASNFAAWQIMKAMGISRYTNLAPFVAHQVYYSLESRDVETEIMPVALDQNVGVTVWSPLAGGLLSGKYRRGNDATEGRRAKGWTEPPISDEDRLWATVDALDAVAKRHGATPSQIALAWTLTRPGVTSLVIGARTEEQLAENIGTDGITLTPEDLKSLNTVSRPRLPYPFWHRRNFALDRPDPAEAPLMASYAD